MCNLSLGIAKESAYTYKGYNMGVERGIDGERKRMTIDLLKEHVAIPIIISVSGMKMTCEESQRKSTCLAREGWALF